MKYQKLLFIVYISIFSLACTGVSAGPKSGKGKGSSNSILVAPSSLTASALSYSQIKLTWPDTNKSETGYAIERKLSTSANFSLIYTTSKNSMIYYNSNLKSQYKI